MNETGSIEGGDIIGVVRDQLRGVRGWGVVVKKGLGEVGDEQGVLSSYETGLFRRTRQVGSSGGRRSRYPGGGDGSTGMFAIDGFFSEEECVAYPPS